MPEREPIEGRPFSSWVAEKFESAHGATELESVSDLQSALSSMFYFRAPELEVMAMFGGMFTPDLSSCSAET